MEKSHENSHKAQVKKELIEKFSQSQPELWEDLEKLGKQDVFMEAVTKHVMLPDMEKAEAIFEENAQIFNSSTEFFFGIAVGIFGGFASNGIHDYLLANYREWEVAYIIISTIFLLIIIFLYLRYVKRRSNRILRSNELITRMLKEAVRIIEGQKK